MCKPIGMGYDAGVLIRDSVHGDVALDEIEASVLDAPEIQRLRGIKQLGAAYLVYPGCMHTRFEHSLGTCHLAHRIVAALRRQGARIEPDLETAIGVAALLHDVTHVPFGHTLEDERCLFPRHDKGTRLAKLLAGDLGTRLERLGVRRVVAALLGLGEAGIPLWARQIVSSTIDADLLDYLKRDSYHAGLAQAYDDRVLSYFTVADGQLAIHMTKHGMERPDARSETIQLLRLRYFLAERVYYHHTKVAAGAMVSKAVELAQAHGAMGEDELMQLADATLLCRLGEIPSAGAPDPAIARLAAGVERRTLLKRGYVIPSLGVPDATRADLFDRFHADRQARREAEAEAARRLGCDETEVVLYCPALTVMKEAAALVQVPSGLCRLNEYGAGTSEIQALETRYAQLWCFYLFVPEEKVDRAAVVGEDMFGSPSALRRA